ncbi:hypothetical protein [Actinomadura rubrisoli]|uniref:Uncharacterized protein n=1 Tax=Actinomadura rubrisoli TaxID=2530368 RepID=A0A4V2YZR2_9ACTN|nr:hypothetical protein [Actinomadura rubrisoli]TDD98157.1 hypothetical protein E1298_00385 [Actinomadura rubrisoli]
MTVATVAGTAATAMATEDPGYHGHHPHGGIQCNQGALNNVVNVILPISLLGNAQAVKVC